MKITLERLKEVINMVSEINGELQFKYVPLSTLHSLIKLSDLYYGSGSKITIDNNYIMIGRSEILEINDESILKLYNMLDSNIHGYIIEVFKKFDWEYEELKYFSDDDKKYKKFKKEVLKLKNGL